jgi:competence protein ComEA
MSRKMELKSVRFDVILLLVGLVGLSLILGSASGYGQTKKALIDLNTASEKELEAIKGIGPAMAKKIVAGRPFKSVDDLTKAGIPAKTVDGMKPFVTIGSSTAPTASVSAAKPAAPPKAPAKETSAPQKAAAQVVKTTEKAAAATAVKLAPGQKININKATKEQLEALPEIGPVKAQAIIDGRPYKKIDDVMKIKGIKEGTFGKIKDIITVD